MSACDGCAGTHQKPNEPAFYNVLTRKWLCSFCYENASDKG